MTCDCNRSEFLYGPEFECRFGIFKNKTFYPGLDKETFLRILNKIKKCPQVQAVQKEKDWDLIRRFYVSSDGKTFRTSMTLWPCCGKLFTHTIEKKVQSQIHLPPQNGITSRIALSSESKPDDKEVLPFITNTNIVRLILRKTFKYKCFEWCFSIVYSGKTRSEAEQKMLREEEPQYELELEIECSNAYFDQDNQYISKSIYLKIQDILALIS